MRGPKLSAVIYARVNRHRVFKQKHNSDNTPSGAFVDKAKMGNGLCLLTFTVQLKISLLDWGM